MAKREEKGINNIKSIGLILITIGIPIVLIVAQPDLGTSISLLAILIGMLFVAGLNYKLIFGGLAAIAAAIPIAWFYLLKPFQRNRILIFLNPELDPLGHGMNALQSMMSIGSGQVWGQIDKGAPFQATP